LPNVVHLGTDIDGILNLISLGNLSFYLDVSGNSIFTASVRVKWSKPSQRQIVVSE